ncbi:hypothetical protein GCM10008018_29800 [Paenibacillus marchantiophytorum]|uniref:Uncharacterized protein n=1 Tax=Paenibacillus marchantiophytorum TaxID=1619310 RepID=A0ABQ1EQC7_9BACL|nr:MULTISPECIES: hypothetical protein [Paenibacillus]UKS24623.1 hypothetical protein LOZ80_23755 [Paenibacillus sp. HWE-109]GFZ82092.1 hypothetical protein GCM10008018_29800 [Paenibacillus marchantiophytorum]
MTTETSDNFSAFASLNRYFTLSQSSKPTLQQAEEAAAALYRMYGADTEEELLLKDDPELIEIYNETKNKIFSAAM